MAGAPENKVEFGLRNAYYALATLSEETGKVTFAAPKKIPGAVTLTMDPNGDIVKFKADDIDYYTNSNNQGYKGTLTVARVTDEFRVDVLGEEKTESGVLIENAEAQAKPFALLFEFQGDKKATRHVMYYCTASRPSEASKTKDGGDINTTDLSIEASPRPDNMLVKAKTTPGVTEDVYSKWYTKVFEKEEEVPAA